MGPVPEFDKNVEYYLKMFRQYCYEADIVEDGLNPMGSAEVTFNPRHTSTN
jgi:hypothetical protein